MPENWLRYYTGVILNPEANMDKYEQAVREVTSHLEENPGIITWWLSCERKPANLPKTIVRILEAQNSRTLDLVVRRLIGALRSEEQAEFASLAILQSTTLMNAAIGYLPPVLKDPRAAPYAKAILETATKHEQLRSKALGALLYGANKSDLAKTSGRVLDRIVQKEFSGIKWGR